MRAIRSINVIRVALLFIYTNCNTNGDSGQEGITKLRTSPKFDSKGKDHSILYSESSLSEDEDQSEDEDNNQVVREQKIAKYREITSTVPVQYPPTYDIDWLLNVFQEILVPKRGQYRKIVTPYSSPSSSPPSSPPSSPSRSNSLTSSPMSPSSSTLSRNSSMNSQTSSIPSDFDEEQEQIRKYLKLNLSAERAKETYRFTEMDAETAFITRYYGFLNPDYNRTKIIGMVQWVEDKFKTLDKLALYNGPNKFNEFSTWSDREKHNFCTIYISYSFILQKEEIYYDENRINEIKIIQATVRYRHELLKRHTDPVRIVSCPCQSKVESFSLGVLPVSYQRNARQYTEEKFWYDRLAFIYHDFKRKELDDGIFVRVRALTKIDLKTLEKDLKEQEKTGKKEQTKQAKKRQQEIKTKEKQARKRTRQEKLEKLISFRKIRNFFHHHKDEESTDQD